VVEPHPRLTLPGPVVSADWLAAHLDEVALVDVRWAPGGTSPAEAFAAGHLPGAVRVDLDDDLADPPTATGGRHPLPPPAAFAEVMARAGVGDGTPVVVYDDAKGSIAARLWWMLRVLDHPVAVLDGGIDAWRGDLATGSVRPAPAVFTERPWPAERFVDADEVDALRSQPAVALLLDARAGDRFAGAPNPLDPRPGHIPGARSAPWAGNVDEAGRFLPVEALRTRFADLGAPGVDRIVASCGSGVTACHDLLALELAGFGRTALFVGSWSAWAADPTRPVATGAGWPDERPG